MEKKRVTCSSCGYMQDYEYIRPVRCSYCMEVIQMGDLTENFSRWEFACKCGCGFDDINIGLINRLQVIRDIIQVSMTINSGCRCKAHNKAVGGANVSIHLIGDAADWCFSLSTGENLYFEVAIMLKNWSGGFHYYKNKRFFHTDVGKKRRW